MDGRENVTEVTLPAFNLTITMLPLVPYDDDDNDNDSDDQCEGKVSNVRSIFP